jgi:hypothetical protein
MENEKQRLVNASQLREFLRKQLEAGITPDHYRIHWLHQSVFAVIATLGNISAAFNRAHPLDKVTALDLIDILNSTRAKIVGQVQQELEGG